MYKQHERILKVFQTTYIEPLLIKFTMQTCNHASIPIDLGKKLSNWKMVHISISIKLVKSLEESLDLSQKNYQVFKRH